MMSAVSPSVRFDAANSFVWDGGVGCADLLEIDEGDADLSRIVLLAILLDEDLDLGCSGLLRGSRSFTFLMIGRLGTIDFEDRRSPDFALCPVDDTLVCELVFGKDVALCFDDDDAADLLDGFFSSSMVMESTDIACASSAVDSPAAGIATSPNFTKGHSCVCT